MYVCIYIYCTYNKADKLLLWCCFFWDFLNLVIVWKRSNHNIRAWFSRSVRLLLWLEHLCTHCDDSFHIQTREARWSESLWLCPICSESTIRWKRGYNKSAHNAVNGSPAALTPLSLCARALINRVRARHHYPVKSLMIGRSVAGPWWLSLSAIR